MRAGSEKHIDSLDGLRGLAILLVFFYHYLPRNLCNPLSWLASVGWTGVDLFFVLSGFLITGILYDTRGAGNFFRAFYARRALRLFPIYFAAVGIILSAAALSHVSMSWKAIPFYIYGANLMLAVKDGVPDFSPYFSGLHFWTLALEEQFYSLWPLILFFVLRRRTLMQICGGGILGALLLRIVFTHFKASPWILYTWLPMRMDSLLAGGLLALGLRGPNAAVWRSRRILYSFMVGYCLILVALFIRARTLFFSSGEMTSWGYSMTAGLYVCVVALALMPGTVPNRLGRLPFLRFFGRYSYGLYVWHHLPAPICGPWQGWFIRHIHPLVVGQLAYVIVLLAVFTALAMASYHLVEVRFLKLKSHFQYKELNRNLPEPAHP